MQGLPPLSSRTQLPHLRGVMARQRLLDALASDPAPLTWIAAPPGSGKTTLAAAFAQAWRQDHGQCVLWYRVDRGDNDPAAFFQGMRQAADQARGFDAAALPLFPADAAVSLDDFARLFFRAFYARFAQRLLLVLDDFQAADTSFHGIALQALEQLPEPHRGIVLSLADPPAALARQLANGRIVQWNPADMLLTREESDGIALSRLKAGDAALAVLHERSAGWAAGLVLMVEHRRRHPSLDVPALQDSHEAVFDYFAAAIYASCSAEEQHLLITTAGLPRLSAELAQAASGLPQAGRLLERLQRRHLFVERSTDARYATTLYRYHALFNAFLCARARAELPAPVRARASARAAALLQAQGQWDDAVAVLLAAGQPTAAVPLILEGASAMASQGRWRTLRDWIAALPLEAVQRDPWLLYWGGAAQVWSDPIGAQQQLLQAFEGFDTVGDRPGRILAAGVMTRACILCADWHPLDRWIDALAHALRATGTVPDAVLGTGSSRLLYATLARQPGHASLPAWADRTQALLGSQPDASEGVMVAYSLLFYFTWTGQTARGDALLQQTAPLLDAAGLSPVSRVHWLWAQANFLLRTGEPAQALACIDAALALAVHHGLRIAGVIRRHRVAHLLTLSRSAAAQAELALLANGPLVEPYTELRAWLAWQQGLTASALAHVQVALHAAQQRGRSFYVALDWLLLAGIAASAGDAALAEEALRHYSAATHDTPGELAAYQGGLMRAFVALQRGDRTRCHLHLRRALQVGQEQRYSCTWGWGRNWVTPLLSEALQHGMAVEYVCSLIRLHRMPPPQPAPAAWPWPVRICALGRWDVWLEGAPLRVVGKSQKKPLELLKLLVAQGDREVAVEQLIEQLWPDPDEGGRKAFDVTVHRLRKLLRLDAAVAVGDGHVRLDPSHVWVDDWALTQLLDTVLPLAAPDADLQALLAAAPQVFGLYLGPLFAADADVDVPWQVAPRNRASARFQRFVQHVGVALESTQQFARAADLYQRVTELDPLAEAFYRRQMRCLLAQDQQAEALQVFRRCRHVLSTQLGIAPSDATQALYRALNGSGPQIDEMINR